MNKLTVMIEQWAVEKGLKHSDPFKQLAKVGEEYGELCKGMVRSDDKETMDALGDLYVTITILAMQKGWNIKDCVQMAYDTIKDRQGEMINGTFVKEEDIK